MTKSKNKAKTKLYVLFTEYRTGGEPIHPDERFSECVPQVIEHTPISLHLDPQGWSCSSLWASEQFLEGEVAHVVLVHYTTGDTFGHSEGNAAYVDAFKSLDDAQNLIKLIRNGMCPTDYHMPWIGYFEELETVRVVTFTVRGDYAGP